MTHAPSGPQSAESTSHGQWPDHVELPEPDLAFGSRTGVKGVGPHPLKGLLDHGPFSLESFGGESVRVATVTTPALAPRLRTLLGSLRSQHQPSDRKAYVPAFPGFRQVFGVDLTPAEGAQVTIEPTLEGEPHRVVATKIATAIRTLNNLREKWDVIVICLPRSWESARVSPDGEFDLHDSAKAMAAPMGVPTQFIWEHKALSSKLVCSVAWRLSIALYAKAGGTPWRLHRTTDTDVAYIGLAYARRAGTADGFVTCCSQVFDADGGGMDFVAFDVGQGIDMENPHLDRDQMRAVMARSVRLYQDRHAGRLPRKIVVHKTSDFRDEEADAVADAWSGCDEIECVRITVSTPWRGVRLVAPRPGPLRSQPDNWPVSRGTIQHLSGREVLLWINGTAPGLGARRNFYQGNKSIPSPILLSRDMGSGPLEETAADALALSKMDWNNDSLYDPVPVTIRYSQTLAKVVGRSRRLPDSVYPYRLFM